MRLIVVVVIVLALVACGGGGAPRENQNIDPTGIWDILDADNEDGITTWEITGSGNNYIVALFPHEPDNNPFVLLLTGANFTMMRTGGANPASGSGSFSGDTMTGSITGTIETTSFMANRR